MTATMEKPTTETKKTPKTAGPSPEAKSGEVGSSEMDMNIASKLLLRSVGVVMRAVPSRTPLSILQHILMDAEGDADGRVTMLASDLELWISHSVPAYVKTAGKATMPAKWLSDMASRLPGADVCFQTASQATTLRCGSGKFKQSGLDPDEMPLMPVTHALVNRTLDAKELCRALRQTMYAATEDQMRPILAGVNVICLKEVIEFVATDGNRMGFSVCPTTKTDGTMPHGTDDETVPILPTAVIPTKALKCVLAFAEDSRELTLTLCGGVSPNGTKTDQISQARFHMVRDDGSETTVLTRIITGQFPNWQRIVPSEGQGKPITIHREALKSAVRRASMVAINDANRVVMTKTDDGAMRLTSQDAVGNTEEVIDADWQADAPRFGINFSYLADALDAMEDEGVVMDVSDPMRAVLIKGTEGDGSFALVMPMQVL